MMRVTLPYNFEDMETIQADGAIVDMASLNFPASGNQKKISFIFLRNTGFDKVQLDFSSCSYEDKVEFLKLYLTEEIDVKNKEFALTWIKIMNFAVNNHIGIDSILTDEEIVSFLEEHRDIVMNAFQMVVSLPLYALSRFSLNEVAFDLDNFEKSELCPVGCNFANLFQYNEFLFLYAFKYELPPLFYTQVFTLENIKLFEAIKQLPFFDALYGLCTASKEEWKEYTDAAVAFNAGN